ncbi:hypothetical protein ACJDU8_12000 [Clostridium sp. WILCCON 0269]|uniref:EamA domain-containing protein n=1 Tax=Candidatus Clostridium eludens TaxID=3381663 RepID=A0ABW8SKY9_9CLOT
MDKNKILSIVLLCLGGMFVILGSELSNKVTTIYSTISYGISSAIFIIWATLFVGKNKRLKINSRN